MKQRTEDAIGFTVAVIVLTALLLLVTGRANATNTKPKPPQGQEQYQDQYQGQGQDQRQTSELNQTATGGEASSTATGGDASSESASAAVSDSMSSANSDNAVAISNVYMSRAFAQDFPITHGCFQGMNAGGDQTTQTKSTGAFFGFTFLNNSCHMQALAAAEKDIEIVSRLQCGDRKYRKAVAFDAPKGTSKREHCIAIKKQSLMGAIEEERKRLEQRLQATENMLELQQSHKAVCDESLERCQEKAYGGK